MLCLCIRHPSKWWHKQDRCNLSSASVCIFYSCYNKLPQTLWLTNNTNLLFYSYVGLKYILGLTGLKSRCEQGVLLSGISRAESFSLFCSGFTGWAYGSFLYLESQQSPGTITRAGKGSPLLRTHMITLGWLEKSRVLSPSQALYS